MNKIYKLRAISLLHFAVQALIMELLSPIANSHFSGMFRYPVHQSSLQSLSSALQCTPHYSSSYYRISWQNATIASSRLLHTAVTCCNQDRFADSEDFPKEFSDRRSNVSGRGSQISDENDFSDSYASRDYRGQGRPTRRDRFSDPDDEQDSFSSQRGGFGRGRGDFRGGRGGYLGRSQYGGTRRDDSYDQGRQGFDLTDFTPGSGAVDQSTLPPVKKNFFEPTSQLTDRTDQENKEYLQSHKIIVNGQDLPSPIQQFSDVQFPQGFAKHLSEFQAPTPIQAQGWSAALQGSDLIGIGQVGKIFII